MSMPSDLSIGTSPYPGLRPFRSDEADIFFGREEHIDHVLTKLGQNRFLAVMGPSGCGKSSLMRAGVIPALETGFLAEAGAEWRIAQMRPGNNPIERLAEGLLADTALALERAGTAAALAVLQATLQRGPLGVGDVLRETPLPEGASLLLLVDQFEEIFRFRQQDYSSESQADAFVALLLATATQRDVPIYVVLTMRSDFLGDCALFRGLPEAINDSQFLTPRLTRAQQRVAIEGPASVFGSTIEPALVNRLLNDMGPDPDQLPLMQHALMRMWTQKTAAVQQGDADSASGITLTVADYEQVGGLHNALSQHADEAFAALHGRQQRLAETLFRCLSERSVERRDTRRPVALRTVAAVVGVAWHDMADVVEVFRHPERSFLTPPVGRALQPETILDISHESLIRQWHRMTAWVEQEAQSAAAYRRLEQTARLWQAEPDAPRRKDYLWHGHELDRALEWRAQEHPTSTWAERYGTAFDLAMIFLDVSAQEEDAKRQQHEAAQRRELQQTRRRLWGAVIGLVVMVFLVVMSLIQWNKARQAKEEAEMRRLLAEARRQPNELGALLALEARNIGNDSMRPQVEETLRGILGTAHFSHTLSAFPGVRVVAFSPDSRWLAALARESPGEKDAGENSREQDSKVYVWDLQQPTQQPHELLPKGRVRALAFSPTNPVLLASGGDDIRLWKIDEVFQQLEESAQPSKIFGEGGEGSIRALAFGPHGKRLVSGSSDGVVQVWELPHGTGRELGKHDDDYNKTITAVAFSPDGRWVASGGWDRTVRLWNPAAAQPRELQRLMHKNWVTSVAFSPELPSRTADATPNQAACLLSRYVLASGSADTTVHLWDMSPLLSFSGTSDVSAASWEPCQTLKVEAGGVWALAFNRDGTLLATGSDDRTVRLWNWQQRTPFPEILRGHDGWVSTVALSLDGRWLASGGFEHTIRLWEMHSPYILRGHKNGIPAVAFSPDGQKVVSGDMDDTVRLWKRNASNTYMNFFEAVTENPTSNKNWVGAHSNWVWSVAFSPDGTTFASGGFDNTVRLWDVHTLHEPVVLPDHTTWVTAVAFSPLRDRPLLATAERGEPHAPGRVHLWDVVTLKQHWIDEGSWDWMYDSPARLGTFPTAKGGTWSVAFSPDGTRLITGDADGSVRLWDIDKFSVQVGADPPGKPKQFRHHESFAWKVAFSPDNRTLVSGSFLDATIHIRNVETEAGVILGGAHGHKGSVMDVAFSFPDGQWLASGGGDGTVRLWKVEDAMKHATPGQWGELKPVDLAPYAVLRGHEGVVRSLAFSPDGQWLISGGGDKTLRLWDVQALTFPKERSPKTLHEIACQRVWRNLSANEWKDIVYAGETPEPPYKQTCPNLPSPSLP